MQATVATLLLLLVGAASQSYMQQPPGRLNNGAVGASQVAPCGEGTNSPSPNWYPGGTYTITWTENQDSDDPVYLNLLKEVTVDTEIRFNTTINGTEVENTTIVSNTSITFYRNLRTLDYNTNTYNLRLPTDITPGFYYLQWNWTTYYSCAYINVSADPVGWKILRVNQPQTALVPVQTYHYYEFSTPLDQQNFYEVFGTGPTQTNAHITVVGKMGYTPLPSMDNGGYTVMSSTAGNADFSISFCRDTINVDYSIGVIGAAGADAASSYTINARPYPRLVNANNILTSGKHNGKKYYVTNSYETEKRRRLVLAAEGDFATPLSFTLADNCRQTNTLIRGIQIGTTKGCIQLPITTNNKYIEVSSVNTPYTLSVEVGECTEVNAGSIAKFSLLLLAAVLAVFVF